MGRSATVETIRPVYEAIKEFWEKNDYAPSIRDLSEKTGLATSNVYYHLEKMQVMGCIEFEPKKARTIRIVADLDEKWRSNV